MKKRSTAPDPRQLAYAILRRAKRPDTVTLTQWKRMMSLLWVIAHYQPSCYYSQVILAVKADMSTRSVKRYVALAQRVGLLVVIPDVGVKKWNSPSKTNQYLIFEEDSIGAKMAPSIGAKMAHDNKAVLRTASSTQSAPSVPESLRDSVTSAAAGPTARRPTGGKPMPRQPDESDAEFRARVSAAAGEARIRKRPPAADRDPARRLGRYFAQRWSDEVLAQDEARFKHVRPLDSQGEASGYIRATFLHPGSGRVYTEDEVRAFIDGFMAAALAGTARIKDKQTAWKCFTGWWGRSPIAAYDAGAYQRAIEEQRRRHGA